MLSYARLTLEDPNAIKRLLQRRRLHDALHLLPGLNERFGGAILDIGGGDGYFAQMIAERVPRARVVCFEPAPLLRAQAAERFREMPDVELVSDLVAVEGQKFDAIYCLEVLEHLPRRTMRHLLSQVRAVSAADAHVVVGVPNEIYLAAAAKGLFRMARRMGALDTRPQHMLRALVGRPPRRRLRTTIGPGLPYYPHHLGFDHRALEKVLGAHFQVECRRGSPLAWLPLACNSEVYFVCRAKPSNWKSIEGLRRPAA